MAERAAGILLIVVCALAGAGSAARGSTARVPTTQLQAIAKMVSEALTAENDAYSGAKEKEVESINKAIERLTAARKELNKASPALTTSDYQAIRDAINSALSGDKYFRREAKAGFPPLPKSHPQSGAVAAFDSLKDAIAEKESLVSFLDQVVKDDAAPAPSLDEILRRVDTALADEDAVFAEWSTDAARERLDKARGELRRAVAAAKTAGRAGALSDNTTTSLLGSLRKAYDEDLKADDAVAARNLEVAKSELEIARAAKKKALATLTNGMKHKPVQPLAITPVEAVFVSDKKATRYSVDATTQPRAKKTQLRTYTWTLTLKLVDSEGEPDPRTPGSGADWDPTCNNAYLAGGAKISEDEQKETAVYRWTNQQGAFLWYHGDAGFYAPSAYGCNHMSMGPKGHQGIVQVTVREGIHACTASFSGTNQDVQPEFGGKPACT